MKDEINEMPLDKQLRDRIPLTEEKALSLHETVSGIKQVSVTQDSYQLNLNLVERLAANGLTDRQIAAFFGMSLVELRRKKQVSDALDNAIETGRSKGIAKVANSLFINATENNQIIAQIFFLKSRAGWREADKLPPDEEEEHRVKVYLPDNSRG